MRRHLVGLLALVVLAGTVACAIQDCRCFAHRRVVGVECDLCFAGECA